MASKKILSAKDENLFRIVARDKNTEHSVRSFTENCQHNFMIFAGFKHCDRLKIKQTIFFIKINPVVNLIKHFTIVIYNSRVALTRKFPIL